MSLNYVILSGHLVQDSEIRYTVSGKAVLEFNLALVDTHQPDQTHTIRVINRRESSPELQRQLRKGTNVIVEGQIQKRKSEVSGIKRMQPEIQLESLSILGSTHMKGTAL
jgi:single-strand DNA-binding protein